MTDNIQISEVVNLVELNEQVNTVQVAETLNTVEVIQQVNTVEVFTTTNTVELTSVGVQGIQGVQGVKGDTGFNVQQFSVMGALGVGVGNGRFYAPYPMTISNVRLYVDTAPQGANLIVDVNLNGSSIFTTHPKPTILAGANYSATNTPNITNVSAGEYLTVDIDQVGSTVAGSYLTVQIEFQ